MTVGVLDTIDLVEHGRETGLFPKLPSATRMATVVNGTNPDDISTLLHRESGRVGLPWSDTPIILLKGSLDLVLTPLTASITGATAIFGEVLDAGLRVWRPSDEWELTGLSEANTPVFERLLAEQARPVEEFSILARRIREVADLTVPEFARLIKRSREAYYLWMRKGPTKEARARAEAISEALAVVAPQPAHRVHDWLLANSGERFNLLVEENYTAFAEQARQWLAPSTTVMRAREMTMDEVRALAAEEPADAGQRVRAYLASMSAPAVTPVRASPNFYRDILVSDEDEDE